MVCAEKKAGAGTDGSVYRMYVRTFQLCTGILQQSDVAGLCDASACVCLDDRETGADRALENLCGGFGILHFVQLLYGIYPVRIFGALFYCGLF